MYRTYCEFARVAIVFVFAIHFRISRLKFLSYTFPHNSDSVDRIYERLRRRFKQVRMHESKHSISPFLTRRESSSLEHRWNMTLCQEAFLLRWLEGCWLHFLVTSPITPPSSARRGMPWRFLCF